MAGLDDIRNDLDRLLKDVAALRAQAGTKAAAAPEPEPAAEPAANAAETEGLKDGNALKDLEEYLTSKAGEAEEAVEEHPLVAMAAAFLLGLAIGRFTPR